MRIGVGVEGPSDFKFWTKVLHKHFRGIRFDVRNMKNCGALIRETPRLLESFRSLHYDAAFVIIDRDKIAHDATRCPGPVIAQFSSDVQTEARTARPERYLSICVAVRGLESWFLADANAIQKVLEKVAYEAPEKTDGMDAGKRIEGLWLQQYGRASFNKIDFAERIATPFDPDIAREHSDSFAYFWQRISDKCYSAPLGEPESSDAD